MDKVIFYGVSLDGKTHKLENVILYETEQALYSPAVSMLGEAAVEEAPASFYRVLVWSGGKQIYDGLIDRQSVRYSEQGLTVSVEARTRGGLLLDNEALPQTLYRVSLSTIFEQYIKVYGFERIICASNPILSQFTVKKGLCEWEALTSFCMRALNAKPYVDGTSVRVGSPLSLGRVFLSNENGGIPFRSLESITDRYSVLSKICIRDDNGAYSTAVSCQAAVNMAVRRKRYVIPPSDLGASASQDANQRLKTALQELERIKVDLPGLWELLPGQRVKVQAKGMSVPSLCVEQAVIHLEKNGLVTKLDLVEESYLF